MSAKKTSTFGALRGLFTEQCRYPAQPNSITLVTYDTRNERYPAFVTNITYLNAIPSEYTTIYLLTIVITNISVNMLPQSKAGSQVYVIKRALIVVFFSNTLGQWLPLLSTCGDNV